MAVRKVFVPNMRGRPYVKEYDVEFQWDFGNSIKNTQESIRRMHLVARKEYDLENISEISGASTTPLGRLLSAFQLPVIFDGIITTVECAYQGSKVFENGGPYHDLYQVESRLAKKDPRLKDSGKLIYFQLGDREYSPEPKTAFYDMLYIGALHKFIEDSKLGIHRFMNHFGTSGGFTDIYFNPKRGINCQARSVALYISLSRRNMIDSDKQFQSYNTITERK